MADSAVSIWLVGLNHRVAPVGVRERLAFTPARLVEALPCLLAQPGVVEGAVLSTCNRTEVYAALDGATAPETIIHFLAECHQLPRADFAPYLYLRPAREAARHLMRVAAGLDSLVIGENEILGQVKEAFQAACQAGTVGPILSALFRQALRAGKRARSETDIGRMALSVADIVVELAQGLMGDLEAHTALIVGAGKMSSLTGRALVRAGLRCVLVSNRTYERAVRLAQALGGRAVHFDALPQGLIEADIVISSTGAPHYVIHESAVWRAMAARPKRPLLLVDIAVPRDVDPEVGCVPGVHLYDIDDLEALVIKNHPLAHATLQAAETVVDQELDAFLAWLTARRAAPTIAALRASAEEVRQAELRRALAKLGPLPDREQNVINALTVRIVNKLLHQPITRLKEPGNGLDQGDCLAVARALFGLEDPT